MVSHERTQVMDALRPRHLAARELAHEWMARRDSSIRGLARRLGEHPSHLYRFLDDRMQHAPCPQRPAMMRVLHKVEQHCRAPVEISHCSIDREVIDPDDDERIWFRNHTLRTRALREGRDPGEGLGLVAEFSEQAACGPLYYRHDMCTNTILTIAVLLDHLRKGEETSSWIRAAIRRVDKLEQAVLECLSEAHEAFCIQRTTGYAGCARACAGLLLEDPGLLDLGLHAMFQASDGSPDPTDRLCHNPLAVINRMLELGHGGAIRWAEQAAEHVKDSPRELWREALRVRGFYRLRSAWLSADQDALVDLGLHGG